MTEVQKPRRLVKWHKATVTDFGANIKAARKFIHRKIVKLPRRVADVIVNEYVKRYENETAQNPTRAANIYLREITRQLEKYLLKCPLPLDVVYEVNHLESVAKLSVKRLTAINAAIAESMAECPLPVDILRNRDKLEAEAKDAAQAAHNTLIEFADSGATRSYETNLATIYNSLCLRVEDAGLKPPVVQCDTKAESMECAIVRMVDAEWWLRRYRRLADQIREHFFILAGYVRKHGQAYASNDCVKTYQRQQKANADYLAAMDLVDEDSGERVLLADIASATTSNPEKRRIEMMVRTRGLEDLADDFGYVSYFVTWTAPSQYHRNSPKYNGSKPNETQRFLCDQWAKARAKIKRHNIEWFGVRVAEPHADATPHWHMLIFVKPEHKELMQSILRDYAIAPDRDELTNQKTGKEDIKPRFDIEEIDRSKGSATGYVAKYISKNVNADSANNANLNNEHDHENDSASLNESVIRVVAWASRWCIRQFQFFGAESVSVWREARRIDGPIDDPAIEQVRQAADESRWDEFTKLMRKTPVKLWRDKQENERGEMVKKIVGLVCNAVGVHTRLKRWRRERHQDQSGGSRDPWSSVNNCTVDNDSLTRAVKNAGLSANLTRPLAYGFGIIDGDRAFKVVGDELRVIV